MSKYAILAWQPLIRPPLPNAEPPHIPPTPLKALSCRNAITSLSALVVSDEPVKSARLVFTDLASGQGAIPHVAIRARLIGTVPTPETGEVCDPLYDIENFSIDRSTAFHISVDVPKAIPAGVYRGSVALVVEDIEVAYNEIELEVANVDLPDVHNWEFFLSVWMNPASVARWHGVEIWSEEHFKLLKPYIEDLAGHGQKTVVAPICYRPWGAQTRDPYPNLITWKKRGNSYKFDFSAFDRYIRLHEDCGIDRAIHCYTVIQAGTYNNQSTIEYIDEETGKKELIVTEIGDDEYVRAWSAFFAAFKEHLIDRNWLHKVYIAFDERPDEVMDKVLDILGKYAPDFRIALAACSRSETFTHLDDLSLAIPFGEHGIAEMAPAQRQAMGVAEMLDPDNVCTITKACPEKTITTFYVCCGPAHPNTFLFSPLVESRMLPYLAAQGGYDGFLRWSYNDWTDDPYKHPEWGDWPTGDVFFVYPGNNGPVSSLRWEQLREGIQDYELALIAASNIKSEEDIVDYEQAIALACRNINGNAKAVGDIEIARRLLIPIAEKAG